MSDHATPEHHDDAEPAGLDPDEPNTPNWLTALGGALFLVAALFFLATAEEDAESGQASAPEGSAAPTPAQPATDDAPSEE